MKEKNIYIFYIFILHMIFFSCTKKNNDSINIDLELSTDSILYSQFAESIEYIELDMKDSCLISDIEKIYLDNDTFILLDTKHAGIFSFTKKGEYIHHIDYYGEGPSEFIDISAFCIDPILNQICIWDYGKQQIIKYDYKGEFSKSYKCPLFVRDFTILKDELNLCILPFYSEHLPSGIWISDSSNTIIKNFNIDVPKDDQVEFTGTYYNRQKEGITYYDRNNDDIYNVTKDSASLLYHINLRQALNKDLRKKDPATLMPFKGFAYMSNFSSSPSKLLISYFFYGKDNPYTWVLFDKGNKNVTIGKEIYNDIDSINTSYHHIYYLNDSTWCTVVERDANNCNILLQILHLKGYT